jgi:hypothetical protein
LPESSERFPPAAKQRPKGDAYTGRPRAFTASQSRLSSTTAIAEFRRFREPCSAMTTPFDAVLNQIKLRGFHNQRLEDHSDIVSKEILKDLRERCSPFGADYGAGKIISWLNVRTPGAQNRKIDLLVGEADVSGTPDLEKLRFCVENKSVMTAHRNQYARSTT